jgi:hypothetical protein
VVSGKDMDLLTLVIESAIKYSANPISKVKVITPSGDVKMCSDLLSSLQFTGKLEIQNEDELIPEEFRILLHSIFKKRYGWVLQQLLKLEAVSESDGEGTLIVDSDTVILRPVKWLNEDGKQILMASLEFNKPYYQFLSRLGELPSKPKYTFVTHHMLLQPEKLRFILKKLGIQNLEELVHRIIKFADPSLTSSISIDYELYGQGMVKFFRNSLRITKFSNVSCKRSSTEILQIKELQDSGLDSDFNSISFHDYL